MADQATSSTAAAGVTPAVDMKLARISLSDNPDPVDSRPPPMVAAVSAAAIITSSESRQNGLDSAQCQAPAPPSRLSASSATTAPPRQTPLASQRQPQICHVPEEDQSRGFLTELQTDTSLPSQKTVDEIGEYIVLDRHGKSHQFKTLYTGKNVARRVLVVFVRHFFCGVSFFFLSESQRDEVRDIRLWGLTTTLPKNCQEYLRTLSAAIHPDSLLHLPISTFIAVVGCGAAELIDTYASETACPFPIYTDPTCKIYSALGMVRTLSLGPKPAYTRKSLASTIAAGVVQGLKQVRTGLATKAGDQKQVGGEFLFEPFSVTSPMDEPQHHSAAGVHRKPSVGLNSLGDGTLRHEAAQERDGIEGKRVSWCHRMKTTRDHVEIPELMEVLGLDEALLEEAAAGVEGCDGKRWSRALEERKGTGLSLASEMSKLGREMEEVAAASAQSGYRGNVSGVEKAV